MPDPSVLPVAPQHDPAEAALLLKNLTEGPKSRPLTRKEAIRLRHLGEKQRARLAAIERGDPPPALRCDATPWMQVILSMLPGEWVRLPEEDYIPIRNRLMSRSRGRMALQGFKMLYVYRSVDGPVVLHRLPNQHPEKKTPSRQVPEDIQFEIRSGPPPAEARKFNKRHSVLNRMADAICRLKPGEWILIPGEEASSKSLMSLVTKAKRAVPKEHAANIRSHFTADGDFVVMRSPVLDRATMLGECPPSAS